MTTSLQQPSVLPASPPFPPSFMENFQKGAAGRRCLRLGNCGKRGRSARAISRDTEGLGGTPAPSQGRPRPVPASTTGGVSTSTAPSRSSSARITAPPLSGLPWRRRDPPLNGPGLAGPGLAFPRGGACGPRGGRRCRAPRCGAGCGHFTGLQQVRVRLPACQLLGAWKLDVEVENKTQILSKVEPCFF